MKIDKELLDHKYFTILGHVTNLYSYAKWKLEKDLNDENLKTYNPVSYDNTVSRDLGALEAIKDLYETIRTI